MKYFVPSYLLILAVYSLSQFSMLALGSEETSTCLDQIAPLNKHQEVFDGPKLVVLSGDVKAEKVVFRRAQWEINAGQRFTGMHTNGIYDHTQMWFVRLKDYQNADERLKSALHPDSLTNRYHCELAFLGKASGCAWFGYMPIYEWVHLQKELGLQNGDDPLGAAARGLAIEDRGSMTVNSVEGVLATAGVRTLPYLKPVLAGTNYDRALRVLSLITNQEATDLLLEYAHSNDPDRAARARYYTIIHPRAEAEKFYFRWLEQEAGQVDVLNLLRACAKVNNPGLVPLLPRVLAAPHSVHELRLAFELSRSVAGKEMPANLLQAEETIKLHGYKSGTNFNQQKVDEAVAQLAGADDVDAAACIGLSLALATTKGDWRAANEAGYIILNNLPNQRGRQMAKALYDACDDQNVRGRLKKVVEN